MEQTFLIEFSDDVSREPGTGIVLEKLYVFTTEKANLIFVKTRHNHRFLLWDKDQPSDKHFSAFEM